eukprot:4819392-Amphidinium_carterae.1
MQQRLWRMHQRLSLVVEFAEKVEAQAAVAPSKASQMSKFLALRLVYGKASAKDLALAKAGEARSSTG